MRLTRDTIAKLAMLPISALTSCHREVQRAETAPPKVEALPYRQASASEVFNLRTKCAELGDKMVQEDFHGPALSISGETHYDEKTNRCYVELDANSVDQNVKDFHNSLFDGQTKELLAFTGMSHGVMSGQVLASWNSESPDERKLSLNEQAIDYIREKMDDDRSG